MHCFACLYCILPHLFFFIFSLRIVSFRTDPFRFQAGCCKRRLNLALVFLWLFSAVLHFWLMNACFCCIRFSFFHTKPRDWLGKRFRNDLFCVGWDVRPHLNQSTTTAPAVGQQIVLRQIKRRVRTVIQSSSSARETVLSSLSLPMATLRVTRTAPFVDRYSRKMSINLSEC